MERASYDYGERKHETCRFGIFAQEAYRVPFLTDEGGEPFAMPLCAWRPPEPHPPAVTRAWGGAIEFERDCAVCLAHQTIPAPTKEDEQ